MTDQEREREVPPPRSVDDVRAEFERLSLALQRAVGEAKDSATVTMLPREGYGEGVWVDKELWEEVVGAYDAIGAYAREVAFEEGRRMAAERALLAKMVVVRVRRGAFSGTPHNYTMGTPYVGAQLCRPELSGDRVYVCLLHSEAGTPVGTPLYVPVAYIHEDDLEKIPNLFRVRSVRPNRS